jgi:hypothetical protein
LPCLHLTEEGAERARVGKVLTVDHLLNPPDTGLAKLGVCAWIAPNEHLVALGQFDDEAQGRVTRGFCESVRSDEIPEIPPSTDG